MIDFLKDTVDAISKIGYSDADIAYVYFPMIANGTSYPIKLSFSDFKKVCDRDNISYEKWHTVVRINRDMKIIFKDGSRLVRSIDYSEYDDGYLEVNEYWEYVPYFDPNAELTSISLDNITLADI